ncbi:hypothetical protein Y032_0042g611 [Ancylostoma ceylanicum]|uniref:Uncharacterized protein n=1 Tax=Ancylostoma ceylanicum TaxID=53326 RepID=A0A016UGA0_9BILA|nr:hypothetical protein Y032_0042g611 [Ancylostoma ceylanicum]
MYQASASSFRTPLVKIYRPRGDGGLDRFFIPHIPLSFARIWVQRSHGRPWARSARTVRCSAHKFRCSARTIGHGFAALARFECLSRRVSTGR